GEFLTELRPAVALFLRFGGNDFDADPDAGKKIDLFVRWVQEVLTSYGGFMLQVTIGDKGCYLYAAFGAPLAHEDDAARAVAAALELRSLPPGLAFVQNLQLGLSQGRMRTGAYGANSRRTYGVLGDDVNLAARLMQAATAGQVLVARSVQRLVAGQYLWEQLSPMRVKGKSRPITVFRLIEARARRPARLLEPRYVLPMVGRTAELALVQQRIDQTTNGQGQIIAITAEAGMGKSRLVAEIIRLAMARGIATYVGECQSYGARDSYLVWESIWRAFFGLDGTEPPEKQVRMLRRQLRAVDNALVSRLPLLGVALNLPLPDNALTRSLDAKLRKASLEALLIDCVRARATTTPLLFVLEDCHWIDPLSHDLIEALGRAVADLPVLLVVAYRPPERDRTQAPRVTALPNCTVIDLVDFSPVEARRLIELKLMQFGGAALPGALVEQIMERAQGNPFYIEELLNFLRDQGLDGGAPELAQIELPSSLHSLILSRIDQLSEKQKTTIKIASVIGRLFQAAMLWGAYPQLGEPGLVRADLEKMSVLDLTPLDTPEPELTYLFRHVLTKEVAYESLPFATRALLHEQIGDYIERVYEASLDQYLDLLAFHFEHSHNAAKRREYLERAAVAAQRAYANDAAIDYYGRLLPLLDENERAPAMLKLAQVLELVGRWDEAGELYQQAQGIAERTGDRQALAQCYGAFGNLLRRRGDYPTAATWLTRARADFEHLGDQAGVSQMFEALGELHRMQGEYAVARSAYEQSLALAETIASPQLGLARRAAALKGAGALAIHQGDYAAAHTSYGESLAILRELDDRPVIASVLSNLGIVVQHEGQYARARELGEEALALRRQLGDRWGVAVSLGNLGMVAGLEGDYARASELYEECLALCRQLGEKNFSALTLNNLGDMRRAQGRYAEARALDRESLTDQYAIGDRWAIAYVLESFAALTAAEAQPERALRLAGAAAALRASIGAPLAPAEQLQLDRQLQPPRQALGEATADIEWQAGYGLTLEQAIAFALQDGA
ncbi:MAG TPA: tetratricopeptide repeat protein, partial [Roseiflexaceae bacterium]|nr:tetratricopeptide repeat protein [Roseiflexaceae bacterium]